MKQSPNPWTLLGVTETATLEEIRLAYRKLAARYHPDRIDGDAEQFKSILSAYEQLKKQSYVPIITLPETKLVNVKLSISQQVNGVNELLELQDGVMLKVRIPPGAKKDDKFKVKSKGTQYIINVQELAHKDFTRHANNVIMILHVDIIDAMTGNTMTITGPRDEAIDIVIPAGVKNEAHIVVENQGLYDRKKRKHGNLYCVVQIDIPVLNTPESIQTFITRLTNDRN
jgi:DnaJ-class molecular chaperone